jgi:phospholipase/carboxylesterase
MKGAGKTKFIPAWHRRPIDQSPLLIVLHGRGDSMKPFLDFQRELGIPELNLLLVNGHRQLDGGYAWCGLDPKPENGLAKTRKMLNQLIDELLVMGFKREKIFIFGFSEGSLVATDFILNSHHRLGGFVGVSGCVAFAKNWKSQLRPEARKTPMLLTHGFLDDVLFHDDTLEQAKELRSAGFKVEWKSFGKTHELDNNEELPFISEWLRDRI